jgi:CBS domain-containing protein
MLCEQIMKCDVKCLTEKDTARAAARLMRDAAIGFVPVCDAKGKIVGTITDRDIVVRIAADGATTLDTPLDKIMSKSVVSCSPKDQLDRAEQLMEKSRKARIVCADDQGKPVGVISLSDIAQHEDGTRVAKLLREVTRREAH